MSNMNNFNNSTPDALSSSKADMESGYGEFNFYLPILWITRERKFLKIFFTLDLGMHRKYGGEELKDPNYLQQNSTTRQVCLKV